MKNKKFLLFFWSSLIYFSATPVLCQQKPTSNSIFDAIRKAEEFVLIPTKGEDANVLISQICIPYKGMNDIPLSENYAVNFPDGKFTLTNRTSKIGLNSENQVIFEIPISNPLIKSYISINPYSTYYVYYTPHNMTAANNWSEWKKPEFMTLRNPRDLVQGGNFSEIKDKLPPDPGAPYIRYRVTLLERDELKKNLRTQDLYFSDSKNSTCPQLIKLSE